MEGQGEPASARVNIIVKDNFFLSEFLLLGREEGHLTVTQ